MHMATLPPDISLEHFLSSSIENVCQAMFDDFNHTNADFRTRAGLKMLVIRREVFHCCTWCANLAGTYEYGQEPHEVWQRHKNCKCMVTTRTSRGTFQDAWSRKTFDTEKEARIEREKEIRAEESLMQSMTREQRIEWDKEQKKIKRAKINARRRELYHQRRGAKK